MCRMRVQAFAVQKMCAKQNETKKCCGMLSSKKRIAVSRRTVTTSLTLMITYMPVCNVCHARVQRSSG